MRASVGRTHARAVRVVYDALDDHACRFAEVVGRNPRHVLSRLGVILEVARTRAPPVGERPIGGVALGLDAVSTGGGVGVEVLRALHRARHFGARQHHLVFAGRSRRGRRRRCGQHRGRGGRKSRGAALWHHSRRKSGFEGGGGRAGRWYRASWPFGWAAFGWAAFGWAAFGWAGSRSRCGHRHRAGRVYGMTRCRGRKRRHGKRRGGGRGVLGAVGALVNGCRHAAVGLPALAHAMVADLLFQRRP